MAPMRRILMLVTAVAVLTGCGGEGEPMTDRDVETVTAWSAAYKPIAADMLATSDALAKQQLDAAGRALARVKPKLDAADARVRALQTPAVRETLGDYMRITRRTITAFDAFVEHLRTDPGDRRQRLRVQDELRDANQELFNADSKVRERIFDHADDAQERRLDQAIPRPALA
jgi:hypothetical protein